MSEPLHDNQSLLEFESDVWNNVAVADLSQKKSGGMSKKRYQEFVWRSPPQPLEGRDFIPKILDPTLQYVYINYLISTI